MFLNYYITFAIAFTAVAMFIWAWVNFKKGLKTWRWVEIEGWILSSRVEQTGTTIEFSHPTYESFATVEYIVGDRAYRTSNVNDFVGTVSSIGKPKTIPKESRIVVYYNPSNPSEAVMIRSAFRLSVFLVAIGIGFLALEWHWVAKTFF